MAWYSRCYGILGRNRMDDARMTKMVQRRVKGTRRFNVHVEREVIVYAATPDDAGGKAIAHFMKSTTEPPADRKMRVVCIEELNELDERGPIIDGAPSRETRT